LKKKPRSMHIDLKSFYPVPCLRPWP
jgi:hypothetical protein